MSLYDRQQGTFDGVAIGAGATARRYGAAIEEWEAHAESLKNRLNQAQSKAEELAEQRLFAQAQAEGQDALIKALKDALTQVCPNHPLLRDDGRRANIQKNAMAAFLAQHGYHYDTQRNKVSALKK